MRLSSPSYAHLAISAFFAAHPQIYVSFKLNPKLRRSSTRGGGEEPQIRVPE
jgi:hypothetical protein